MGEIKGSALPSDASPTTDDLMITIDGGGAGTKKITLAQLATLVSSNITDGAINYADLANKTNIRNFGYSKTAMNDGATTTGIPLCCVNVPSDWVSGTDIVVKCASRNTGASGVVAKRLDIYRFRSAAALTAIVASQNVNRTVTSTNVSYDTLYTIPAASIAAGDSFAIVLSRLGSDGTDTNTGIEDCDAAWIEYTGKA